MKRGKGKRGRRNEKVFNRKKWRKKKEYQEKQKGKKNLLKKRMEIRKTMGKMVYEETLCLMNQVIKDISKDRWK